MPTPSLPCSTLSPIHCSIPTEANTPPSSNGATLTPDPLHQHHKPSTPHHPHPSWHTTQQKDPPQAPHDPMLCWGVAMLGESGLTWIRITTKPSATMNIWNCHCTLSKSSCSNTLNMAMQNWNVHCDQQSQSTTRHTFKRSESSPTFPTIQQ